MADYADDSEGGDNKPEGKLGYIELMQAPNIVPLLDDEKLSEISAKVIAEYDIDDQSRSEWLERNKAGIDLAMMAATEKNYPFANASNIKYPLVAQAAFQFNARAYPAICPPDRVVKSKTYGKDPDGQKAARGDRVSEHMSWQLLAQMHEWEQDTDRMMVILPIVGSCYRKVFYDPSLGRKVTRLVTAERLVFNYWARSFEDLPRLTEVLPLYPYEIQERINDGRFAKFEHDHLAKGSDGDQDQQPNADDSQGPHIFLEQHRLLDLDGDGYPEPYVVTVHKGSEKVCRIMANWSAETAQIAQGKGDEIKVIALRKQSYFIQYLFMPSPDGGAYGVGFGWLLTDLNESINTTVNMTFDAAHLASIQGGFISATLGPKMKNKEFRIGAGEWKVIPTNGPLRDAMMPVNYPGPSPVLMVLLEFLINSGKELAAIKDVLTGDTPATAPVGTTLALIEQGLQVFTSIYKRIYRSLTKEFELHAKLNEKHVSREEYVEFFDDQNADPRADYNAKDLNIRPVSDPQSVTKAQKIAKAQAIHGLAQDNEKMDQGETTRRVLEAIDAEDIDKLVPPPPPPDPMLEDLAKRAAVAEVEAKEGEAEQKNADATAKLATAMKTMAETSNIDVQQVAGTLEMLLKLITTEHSMENDLAAQSAGQGGIPGMEGGAPDQVGAVPAGIGGDGAGAAGGGEPVQLGGAVPPGLGAEPAAGGLQQGAL